MSEKESEMPSGIKNPWKEFDDQRVESLVYLAKEAIESISLMQDLKRLYNRNDEEEILISEIIHEEFLIVKKFMKEAENAKRTQKTA